MFRSAVFRLTAVYLAMVMVITTGFSIVLYKLAVSELQRGFQNQYLRWLSEYSAYGLRQPGNPAAELATRSHHIYLEIIYFNILMLILTGIASYFLARRTLRPIERAHEGQARFTADVSHELRTPLTALTMDTEVALLDKKASGAELRKTLQGNLEEAKRMENLINNLLQLTSLEANKLQTDFRRLNLKDIAADALKIVQVYATKRNIAIDTTLTDGYVNGDSSSLTQLVVILLENAIKYSPVNSTVRVTTSSRAAIASILIEDDGPGIPEADLPHVFDRFYRADNSRTSLGTPGYGLGLSLAKLIADLHNAEIVLSSTAGKGTQAQVIMSSVGQHK